MLKKRLDCLHLNVIDEDLAVLTSYTVYQAENKQWLAFPVQRIRKITSAGVESLLLVTTNYTLNATEGTITLLSAADATDVIRADYSFNVFTDTQLAEILVQSFREVNVLVHRKVDVTSIHEDYVEAVLKRAFSNAFKCLIEPTFNFYNVSVGGRTIDKTMLADTIKKIIDENEGLLDKDINALRNFNQTNRME
jgi:hypothetical protein